MAAIVAAVKSVEIKKHDAICTITAMSSFVAKDAGYAHKDGSA
jgi:hypothetical protein